MENYHAAATWMKLREEPHNFLKKLPAKVGSQGGLEVRVCCYEHLEPPPPLDPPLPAQAVKPSYSPHPHLTGTGVPAQAGHRHDPVHRHEAGGVYMGSLRAGGELHSHMKQVCGGEGSLHLLTSLTCAAFIGLPCILVTSLTCAAFIGLLRSTSRSTRCLGPSWPPPLLPAAAPPPAAPASTGDPAGKGPPRRPPASMEGPPPTADCSRCLRRRPEKPPQQWHPPPGG